MSTTTDMREKAREMCDECHHASYVRNWANRIDAEQLELKELLKRCYSALSEDRKGRTRCVDFDPAGSTYEFTEHDWSRRTREILGITYEPTGI